MSKVFRVWECLARVGNTQCPCVREYQASNVQSRSRSGYIMEFCRKIEKEIVRKRFRAFSAVALTFSWILKRFQVNALFKQWNSIGGVEWWEAILP